MDKQQFEKFLMLSAIAAWLSLFRMGPYSFPHATAHRVTVAQAVFH